MLPIGLNVRVAPRCEEEIWCRLGIKVLQVATFHGDPHQLLQCLCYDPNYFTNTILPWIFVSAVRFLPFLAWLINGRLDKFIHLQTALNALLLLK